MSPADIPPFDDHGNLHPAFLAQIDQQRAETRSDVLKLAKRFREHADTVHGGDPICSHAMVACSLVVFRKPLGIADLAAGAIARVVELEDEVARLGATITQYQATAQEQADRA